MKVPNYISLVCGVRTEKTVVQVVYLFVTGMNLFIYPIILQIILAVLLSVQLFFLIKTAKFWLAVNRCKIIFDSILNNLEDLLDLKEFAVNFSRIILLFHLPNSQLENFLEFQLEKQIFVKLSPHFICTVITTYCQTIVNFWYHFESWKWFMAGK